MVNDTEKQLVMDYLNTFNDDAAKRVLVDIRRASNYDSHILPDECPGMVEFNLGMRHLFLYIKDKLDANPNRERQQESEADDATD